MENVYIINKKTTTVITDALRRMTFDVRVETLRFAFRSFNDAVKKIDECCDELMNDHIEKGFEDLMWHEDDNLGHQTVGGDGENTTDYWVEAVFVEDAK